jgi:voltage-gated sodium channel
MGLPREDDEPQRPPYYGDDHCAEELPRRESTRRSVSKEKTVSFNDSLCGIIAKSKRFENTTLGIIVINALWIGLDTNYNHKKLVKDDGSFPLEPGSIVVENLFCVYFTAEVVIRFFGFKRKRDCCKDAWFVFDSFLVTSMVLETWVLEIVKLASGGGDSPSFLSNLSALRLLRLLRLTRMARLMSFVPELMTLVKGMAAAAKSVAFVLLFLCMVMYVFAIVIVSVVGDPETEPEAETCEHMFGTMGDAMMSLFTNGVLGDNLAATVQAIMDFPNGEGSGTGLFMFMFFMLFFAISSMTLLNMLIGALCEVVTNTAADEKDARQIQELRHCIEDAFDRIDKNSDGVVCEAEWSQIKADQDVRTQLCSLGVEPAHMDERLDQMQQTLFSTCRKGHKMPENAVHEGLQVEDLILKVIDIRPDKPASALDLEILGAKVREKDKQFGRRLDHISLLIKKMIAREAPTSASTEASTIMPEVPSASALQQIPTQLLFHEIKTRALKASSGRGSNLPPSPGAASYSAIKSVCQ